ncbi:hypothetical protein BH24BAC1_BH24BAC1_33840 [soil metagenome]|jgi:hypothetical protein
MKKQIGLLLLGLWGLSCERRESRTVVREEAAVPSREEKAIAEPDAFARPFDNTAEMDSLAEAIGMEVENHPQAYAAQAFMFEPFGVTEQEARPIPAYRQKIQVPVSVQKEPVPNRHRPSRIDTIYHLRFDSSSISLYHPLQSEQYMLASADIKSPNVALKNNIRVGMSRNELLHLLQDYKLFIKEQGDSIEVTALITDTSLVFTLQQNKVRRIKYHPYLD